jgi:phosphoenolpyruvate synthase/pyruvate phosphate dikinase
MTVSDQKNSLTFDENGDLKETPDKCADQQNKRILTDTQARLLAKTALNIKRVFGNKREQDIEWGIMGGRIYIVQSRPYIDKK